MALKQLQRNPLRWLLPVQAILLLANLRLLPVWGDEQFTLDVIALPWTQIGGALAADIHPPFYFFALKLWMLPAWGDPIIWARAFSAIVALCATFAIDRFWLRRVAPETRAWFLALWCLSPLLLLDARMARSYSLQALICVFVLAAMARVVARQSTGRAAALGVLISLLLYTHYLPGLAIGAAALGGVARKSFRAAGISAAVALLLYAPWLSVLLDGLGQAASRDVYRLAPTVAGEVMLRLGYWFSAFSFGEAHDWYTLLIAVLLAPALLRLMARGASADETGFVQAGLLAAPVGFLGTWRWVSFAFTPARLLFLLPVFLLSLALGARGKADRVALAAVLALNVVGIGFYFGQFGYLNLGYLVPYGQVAQQIERTAPSEETLVLVDAFNGDPKPLAAALPDDYPLVVAESASFVAAVDSIMEERAPATVWHLRSARDVSPGGLHSLARDRIEERFRLVAREEYLPYNAMQRRLFELFAGGEAPGAHYVVERWEAVER